MNKFIFGCIFSFALIYFVSGAAIPEEFQEFAGDVRTTCLEESQVDEELVNQAATGNFAKDKKLGCYVKCVADQFHVMTKDGINFKKFLSLTPPRFKEKMAAAIEVCKDTKGTDLCDLAYNLNICFYNVSPEDYFVI